MIIWSRTTQKRSVRRGGDAEHADTCCCFSVHIGHYSSNQGGCAHKIIRSMMAAVQRQPNMSKDVENALPRVEAIIDHLEEAKRDKNEVRRKRTSFAAIAGESSNKMQASASPLAPSEGAKLAKKKKGERWYKNRPPKNGPSFKTTRRKRRGRGKWERKVTTCQTPKPQRQKKRSGGFDQRSSNSGLRRVKPTQKFWVEFATGSTPLSAERESRPSAKLEVGMSL